MCTRVDMGRCEYPCVHNGGLSRLISTPFLSALRFEGQALNMLDKHLITNPHPQEDRTSQLNPELCISASLATNLLWECPVPVF